MPLAAAVAAAAILKRVKGIEPSSSAWKAVALPLSYTRKRIRKGEFVMRNDPSRANRLTLIPHSAFASPHSISTRRRRLGRSRTEPPTTLQRATTWRQPSGAAQNFTRATSWREPSGAARKPVVGAGFEPAKAEPSDLQSDPFDRFGNPPFPATYRRPSLGDHPSVQRGPNQAEQPAADQGRPAEAAALARPFTSPQNRLSIGPGGRLGRRFKS